MTRNKSKHGFFSIRLPMLEKLGNIIIENFKRLRNKKTDNSIEISDQTNKSDKYIVNSSNNLPDSSSMDILDQQAFDEPPKKMESPVDESVTFDLDSVGNSITQDDVQSSSFLIDNNSESNIQSKSDEFDQENALTNDDNLNETIVNSHVNSFDDKADVLIVDEKNSIKTFDENQDSNHNSADTVLKPESIIKPNSVLSMLDEEVLNQTKQTKKEIKKDTYHRQSSTSRLIIPD